MALVALVTATTLAGAPCECLMLCFGASGEVEFKVGSARGLCCPGPARSSCGAAELFRAAEGSQRDCDRACVDIPIPRAPTEMSPPPTAAAPTLPDHAAAVLACDPDVLWPAAALPPAELFARPPPETSAVLSCLRTVILLT